MLHFSLSMCGPFSGQIRAYTLNICTIQCVALLHPVYVNGSSISQLKSNIELLDTNVCQELKDGLN